MSELLNHTISNDKLLLGQYAQRAYLEYAMSVVKGRALPDVADGQKPVQRRILYAMYDMHLHAGAKPVKSARVVGEILGKYHPHGDASAYDAMVRMAQDFTLRYPLIDGVGNFGSRDGDGAAAMRYTEARLTPLAQLLLSEIDMDTVDFAPNYDGAFQEPVLLPARLPMVLLNGASGIAVGMATEIPSHNLKEVTEASIALLKNPQLSTPELMNYLPAPDFAGGGQIITSQEDIVQIYESGKGSIRVRARYEIEKLARGQWRMIVYELPPNISAQKVLAQIEDIINPKPKSGKKQLTQEQQNIKSLMLSLLDRVRDESDADSPIRLVFEPKSARINSEEFIATLMVQTTLEVNVPINLVMIGRNGRPAQKSLVEILSEWLTFRIEAVTRRLSFRLGKVNKRIHILEGRMTAFIHIDEVIRIIREAKEPKAELMQRFDLSDIQAEDILEIRLRQLAHLEWLKLESELKALQAEAEELSYLLNDENAKKKLIIKEMKQDAKEYGDVRRTLIKESERAVLTQNIVDEAVTLILSRQGWIRQRMGHKLDLTQTTFKEGDKLYQVIETRTTYPVIVLDSHGRSYSLNITEIPGGRGDGVPLSSLIEIQNLATVVAVLSDVPETRYILSGSGGYGFICLLSDMIARVKTGKSLMTLKDNENTLPPIKLTEQMRLPENQANIILATNEPRLLAFSLTELKEMNKGRGLQLIALDQTSVLEHIIITAEKNYIIETKGKRGALHQDILCIADIIGKRGRKGKVLNISGSLITLGAIDDDQQPVDKS